MLTSIFDVERPLRIRSFRDLIEVAPREHHAATVAVFPVRPAYQGSPLGDPQAINNVRLVMMAAAIQRALHAIALANREGQQLPIERLTAVRSGLQGRLPIATELTKAPWSYDGEFRVTGHDETVVALIGDPRADGLPAKPSFPGFARWICMAPELYGCAKRVLALGVSTADRDKALGKAEELLFAVEDCWS